ncbi:hypothetical protein TIFTF001_005599 [Ficus carica]|uniref:Cw7 protein n=1 Tax=Ficus carica TaxID=3494 RepID=A0AA88CZL7_FICCA|nr:hypothetical protein TIFTF001_005599 [Ficus carica]
MLGDGEETPSRSELLSMVKRNSKLLGKTVLEEEESSDVEMDPRFWHDVLDLYFFRGTESRRRQDDDLVFLVRKLGTQGNGSNDDKEDVSPYFVRRWAPKVVKTVYASPSPVNFHLDSKKEVETEPAYPDICFAVDDFDSTFDAVTRPLDKNGYVFYSSGASLTFVPAAITSFPLPLQVLTETDHCYCVLLNADGGAAFSIENEQHDSSSSDSSSRTTDSSTGNTKNTKLTLFSGFVSYQMVRDAYDGKTDRLYMKGPGGRGEVEVAVSGVADQSHQDSGPFSPVISKRGFGIGSIVRKAAAVATVAAKHAYAAAASSSSFDGEMVPLKCCLMSISLPWEYIAKDLLFKGSPPVNL